MREQEEPIAGEIMADAQRRADRTRQRAEREASRILEQARREAAREREGILQEARARLEHQKQVLRARMELELQAMRQRRRGEAVERVRQLARQKLAELADSDEHRRALVELALLAIARMSGDEFTLILRQEDRDRWGRELPGELAAAARERLGRQVSIQISDETVHALGGLIVSGAGGRQVADQTFDARLERLWDELRAHVAPLVLGDSEERK